jgi:hypothetical protein
MQMQCGLEFASHSHQCVLPKFLPSHGNSNSHRITSPAEVYVNKVYVVCICTVSHCHSMFLASRPLLLQVCAESEAKYPQSILHRDSFGGRVEPSLQRLNRRK